MIDDGVTLIFRARVPTSGPLDPLHPDGQSSTRDYPPDGDGYVTSDGGKGNFVIRQQSGGAIAFSLTTATDTPGGDPDSGVTRFEGLSMNEFAGSEPSADVNFGQGEGQNVIPLDVTQWHEFWITIRPDDSGVGTHTASFYIDGSKTPQVFKMTTGTGSDSGESYIAMGSTATPQNSALDIDYFGIKFEAVVPEGASIVPPPDIVDLQPAFGAGFVATDGGVSFRVVSQGSLPESGIRVELNGTDYSSQLAIGGTPQDREVALNGLEPDTFFTGQIHVTDAEGATISTHLSFDTFSKDNRIVEAENFNFDQGGYIDMPDLDTGPGSYFDKGKDSAAESQEVDYLELSAEFPNNELAWRLPVNGNMPNTIPNGNEAGRDGYDDIDYSVTGTEAGEWLNYTREFSDGLASMYLRASGGAFSVALHRVAGDAGSSGQETEMLGTFQSGGTGGGYSWLPLLDASLNPARIELLGKTTLRVEIVSGSPDLNFLMVTSPRGGPPPAGLRVGLEGDLATIEWEGVGSLAWARDLVHPIWRPALDASSPYTLAAGGLKNFYSFAEPTPLADIEAAVISQVEDAAALLEQNGEAAYAEITRGGRFLEGELYAFALNSEGVSLAHPADPSLVGQNLWDRQDSNGVYYVREIVGAATPEGSWLETVYHFGNPASGEVEPKRVYAKLQGGVALGSGYYIDPEVRVQEMVHAAIARYGEVGDDLFAEVTGTTNYVDHEIYLFVTDLNAISLAHSTLPEIVGTDRSMIEDINGVLIVTESIALAQARGAAPGSTTTTTTS